MNRSTNRVKTMLRALPFLLAIVAVPASAVPDCTALAKSPIYQVINPATKATLLTPWKEEADNAKQKYGYTDDRGIVFYASLNPAQDLYAAARLYHGGTNDFFWTANTSERNSAVQSYGYTLNKAVDFYVANTAASCTKPVYCLRSGGIHRFTADETERANLINAGWIYEGIKFYGGKPSAPPPNTSVGFYMGIASHLGSPGRKSDNKTDGEIALTEMGATSLRDEVGWDNVFFEQPETFDKHTSQFKIIEKNGGKLVLVLDYGNSRYMQGGGFPDTPDERAKFLQFSNIIIDKIGYKNLAAIEIWNEWDNYMGWGPEIGFPQQKWGDACPTDSTDKAGCPRMYGKLVETLLHPDRDGLNMRSLRQAAPGVPILANAISARSQDWTKAAMNYLRDRNIQVDGAVVHPYVGGHNGCPGTEKLTQAGTPQLAVDCVALVSDEIARDYGKRLPMWITEMGWSRGGERPVSADTQARYLVEFYVRARATNMVQGVWWYDLQDDGPDTTEEQTNFGLIARDPAETWRPGALHPSGKAYSALAHFWAGCTSMSGDYKNNRSFQLTCGNGTRQIILAATASDLSQASAKGATLVDLLGQQADVRPGGNVSSLIGRPVGVK